jgi:hypothetical protein
VRRIACFLLVMLGMGMGRMVIAQTGNNGDQNSAAQAAQTTNSQTNGVQSQPETWANHGKDVQEKRDEKESGTSKDRLFYALPNFLTVESKDLPPLTVKQKFGVVTRGAFDYIQIPWYAALAGISQAENSEPGYGQGAEGYGKRLGAYFADGTIENYLTGAVLPSLLRQDPRYYELGKGSFIHRTEYAVSRIFVTRGDSGHTQFDISEVGGSAAAAFISTYSYHPAGDRNVPNTLSVWGTQVGYDTITTVVKEFWPDIRRRMNKKHQAQAAAAAKNP